MRKSGTVFILFLFVLSAFSCKKEKECTESKTNIVLYAKDVVMTSTAKIGETVPISIYYDYNKGCELLKNVEESFDGFNVNITVSGTKDECACSASNTATSTVYNTRFNGSGTYSLKFLKADGSFITKTIVIQ